MADNKWIHIDNWMGSLLGLRANDLICYAIIYAFSRDGKSQYRGDLSYLASCMFATKQTTLLCLKKLLDQNIILKQEEMVDGIKRCYYKTNIICGDNTFYIIDPNKKPSETIQEALMNHSRIFNGTIQEALPVYNKTDNKENNKENNKKSLSNDKQKDELFEKFWADYGRKGTKARALKEWNRLKDKEKQLVMKTLPEYLIYCKRIKREMKDASSYLYQEYYKEDWNKIPDYYQIQPSDNARLVKFKQYMVDRFKDLIYHRNPLTFEQTEELINDLGLTEFESVMDKLAQRDIHQYFSIFKGVETVLNEEE